MNRSGLLNGNPTDHEHETARRVNERIVKTAEELRFEFGSNWLSFLSTVDEDRIREAATAIRRRDFPARPTWMACGQCPFREICPHTARGRESP